MHLYLDPVGGVSGDMFAAALLDAWPELAAPLRTAFAGADLARLVALEVQPHRDHALAGTRFSVSPAEHDHDHHHHHRSWRDIRAWLGEAALEAPVRARALAMFALLAEAEGRIHGVDSEEVEFHEVGAWDSIADIVAAAWLIEAVGVATWYCAPLPLGRGRVASAHGILPLPAPATALLLEGFPLYQDQLEGERITPTGAAILRHLSPSFAPLPVATLARSGSGFGSKIFPGISNVLRVLAFTPSAQVTIATEQIALCQFELDDQTAEDLALALERLRATPGVLDVLQAPVVGKKGRLASQIQILARPEALDPVLAQCFRETSTLGVRWQWVQRARLARTQATQELAGRRVRVKRAERPDGVVTAKVESDDLAELDGGLAARAALRRRVEEQGDG